MTESVAVDAHEASMTLPGSVGEQPLSPLSDEHVDIDVPMSHTEGTLDAPDDAARRAQDAKSVDREKDEKASVASSKKSGSRREGVRSSRSRIIWSLGSWRVVLLCGSVQGSVHSSEKSGTSWGRKFRKYRQSNENREATTRKLMISFRISVLVLFVLAVAAFVTSYLNLQVLDFTSTLIAQASKRRQLALSIQLYTRGMAMAAADTTGCDYALQFFVCACSDRVLVGRTRFRTAQWRQCCRTLRGSWPLFTA
jgi:hypothetical protein